jgi:hypothetical protein
VAVEGHDIIVDGERIKDAIALPGLEHGAAVRISLHSGDALPAEQDPGPE